MSKFIYIHEDDDRIFDIVLDALKAGGYTTEYTSTSGMDAADRIQADIALLCRIDNTKQTLCVGDITLDLDNVYAVLDSGEQIHLTPIEFSMLQYLMNNAHRAVSRTELLPAVWGVKHDGSTRVADDTAKRLRRKLKNAKTTLETVWNFGFRLAVH